MIEIDRERFISKWGTASQDWTIYNPEVYEKQLSRYRSITK